MGKLSAQLTEGVTARRSLLFPYKSKYVQDLVHGPLSALRATPGDATGIPRFTPPCAGCDACKNLQLSFVLARPSMDLFHRLRGPPSPGMPPASRASRPCAEKAARLAVLVVLPKGKSPSGGMYSAWRRAAIARNRMEGTREHKRSVGAWR
ncbi:hypothetical protein DWZ54_05065 [Mitsuokella sp. AF33-22]|nr:hypothetical protein DWZ54_05065 [Mitsuokella sp. AF33-22]